MNYPIVKIKKGCDLRIHASHPWVYSNEIENISELKSLTKGTLVLVSTKTNSAFAIGYFNPSSLISVRILTYDMSIKIDKEFFVRAIKQALLLREKFFDKPFYRLINSEADFLPGLVIDRFDLFFSVQITTAGMENLKNLIIEALKELFSDCLILFRNDSDFRKLEGLSDEGFEEVGVIPSTVLIKENDMEFAIDPREGQKTGWFFDQRLNRDFIGSISKGAKVLDAFCYLGGFGMNAIKGGATNVTFVDSSASAIDAAKQNVEVLSKLNEQLNVDNHSFISRKFFEVLEEGILENMSFDLIVLDPPAFIKSKKDIFPGLKGYEKLVKLSVNLLKNGGIMMLNSCSHHASLFDLIACAQNGFRKSNRRAKIIRSVGAGFDHPTHPALKESEYLKSITFVVE